MASLLGFVKKKVQQVEHGAEQAAGAAFHGLNPLDNGQGWTNQAPPGPQRSVPQQLAGYAQGINRNIIQPSPVGQVARGVQDIASHIPEVPATSPLRFLNTAAIRPIKTTDVHVAQLAQGHNPYHGTAKQQFGQATQDALNMASVLPIGRGAQLATKGLPAIKAGLVGGAKIGAGFGAAQGASTSLQNNLNLKNSAKTIALSTGLGTIGGAALGGSIPVLGAGSRAIIKAQRPLNDVGGVKNPLDNLNDGQLFERNYIHNLQAKQGEGAQLPKQNTNRTPLPRPSVKSPQSPLTPVTQKQGTILAGQSIPKPLSILKRAALSTKGQLNQLGEGGKAISSGLSQARDISEIGQANFLKQIPSVTGLSHKEFPQFVDTLDALGRGEQPNISPKIGQAVKEWSAAIPQVRQLGEQTGIPVGDLGPTYFPRDYSELLRNSKNINKVAQDLVRTGQAKDLGEAQKMLQFMKNKYDTSFGHFDNSRAFDLPGYDKSKNALINYISGAYNKIGHAKVFGPNGERANQFIDQIGKQGHDVNKALDLYQVGAGIKTYNRPVAASVSSGVRTFNRVRSLGLSAILNAGQTTNTASVGGVLRTGASMRKLLSGPDRDFVHSTGVISDSVLQQLRDQTAGTTSGTGRVAKALQSKVTAPGFASVEKFNRSVAAITGRDLGNSLAARGKVDVLRKEFGITGDIGKRLTPEQEIQAARNIVERTQFKVDPQDLPAWANTPEGKMVAQFRTFTYKQTKFMWDEVIKKAAKGNPLPLIRFLAVGSATGYVGGNIRGALRGQPFTSVKGNQEGTDSSNVAKFIESLNNVGAFGIGSSALFLAQNRFSKRLPQYVAGTIGGPTVGLIAQTGNNAAEAIQSKPANLERQALATIPVVGPKISNTLLPFRPKAKSSTPTGPDGKKLTKRQQAATNSDRQIAWEGMTKKARTNVAVNNPDLYVQRQTAEIQKEQLNGQTTKAFKDARDLGKVQVYRGYDREIGNAYKLNQTDFNAFVSQAPDDTVNKLRDLDKKLLDAGLIAKSKFPKAKSPKSGSSRVATSRTRRTGSTGSRSAGRSSRSTAKYSAPKLPGLKKISVPKGVKVAKVSSPKAFKTRKLSVSKIPKIKMG